MSDAKTCAGCQFAGTKATYMGHTKPYCTRYKMFRADRCIDYRKPKKNAP